MKILILCNIIPNTASTVGDHVSAFIKYSEHKFELFNCVKNKLSLEFLNKFDAVMIHYSILIEMDYYLSPVNRYILSLYQGLKIIFLQDENRNVNKIVSCIKSTKIDIVFTVVPQKEIQKVYPAELLPGVKIVSVLTGFVQENLLNLNTPSYERRQLDVVYRSRKLSACFGRLCYEKYIIAEKFIEDAKNYNLKVDISVNESDRIYGQAWIDFLLSSKACLGVESGASLFDYTGEIRNKIERHELLYPNTLFDELENLYFKGLDYNVHYNQISPRHFEAAALKTLMILYEGDYSGILTPWRHYVPLKKDHSNIAEIITILKNKDKWEEITNNAYLEIASNQQYTFCFFVKKFDTVIKQRLLEIPAAPNITNKPCILTSSSQASASIASITSISKSLINYLMSLTVRLLNFTKTTTREIGAKIFWWLDKKSNNLSKNPETNYFQNPLSKTLRKLVILIKNKIKLIAIKTRDYNKADNKILLLFSIIYYKFYLNKFPIIYIKDNNNTLQFCLEHNDLENNAITNPKITLYDLLFKKIKTCDNCRTFIGF